MYNKRLIQTCTITTRTDSGSKDKYKKPIMTETTIENVPCLLQTAQGGDAGVETKGNKQLIIGKKILFLKADANITEKSTITLDSQTFNVVYVDKVRGKRKVNHIELALEEIK